MNDRRIPRGRPAFAASQREKILELLRAAGTNGVSRASLIFEHRMTQCGARVDELKRQGFVIRSENRRGRYPTWYVLEGEPLEWKPLAEGEDWYEAKYGPRPTAKPQEPSVVDLPLFAERQL